MKKIYLLIYSTLFIFNTSFCQTGDWTWVSGPKVADDTAKHGIQGIPSVNNYPAGVYEPVEWKDKQGNFWVFGGTFNAYCDMWKYNPVTTEWTWIKGDGGYNEAPIYGTKGVASPSNTPGSRAYCAASWVDTSGAFWLFGGYNNSNNNTYYKNDLWKYDLSSNQWTWMAGDSTGNGAGIHGTQGVVSPSNVPGARTETSSAWTDSTNNLWLFGGYGYDDNSKLGSLNDLMKYDISTNEWMWIKGSPFANATSDYGTKGIANVINDPGAMFSYVKWKDLNDNFWIMGGASQVSFFGPDTLYNDMWKYDPRINEWTWMSGHAFPNDRGNYNSSCAFDSVNIPRSRFEQRSSVTDNCGRFWLFGGIDSTGESNSNDLWVYDPQLLEWNLINGNNLLDQQGNYGTLGVASSLNMPPSRGGADAWWGNDNKFYLFGGQYVGSIVELAYSDVWVYNPDTNCIPVCQSSVILPVEEINSTNNIITIYPNPATNQISINGNWQSQTGKADLTIFNTLGQTVLSLPLAEGWGGAINCKSFPSGIYLVEVAKETGRWTGRFVKE